MKISEFIDQLKMLHGEHGDVPLRAIPPYGNECRVESVSFVAKGEPSSLLNPNETTDNDDDRIVIELHPR